MTIEITNPVLKALYERVCKQLEAKEKSRDEVRTELAKKRKTKKYKGNLLDPDKASTISDRVKLKFQMMNK